MPADFSGLSFVAVAILVACPARTADGNARARKKGTMDLRWSACFVTLVALASFGFAIKGQTAAGPTAYTVTARNPTLGAGGETKTYRLGSKALVDQSGTPAEVTGDTHTVNLRTLIDLDKRESLTWDPINNSATCVKEMITGDWGDPFAGASMLAKQGARQVGGETIRGYATRIVETPGGRKGTTRVWVDTATGLVVKEQVTPPGEAAQTVMEVTNVSLSAPAASVFEVPASCAEAAGVTQAAAASPQPQIDAIPALTGGNDKRFMNAMAGPGSKNSCRMAFKVVRAGTMEPIAGGFQVAVDLNLATERNPHYTIGVNEDGRATFSGGELHEVGAQGSDGVFRVDNIPEEFEMDIEFGNGGSAAAKIYRQCFEPQTVLLFVVKAPENLQAGSGWLWVKAGKYAAVPR